MLRIIFNAKAAIGIVAFADFCRQAPALTGCPQGVLID